MTAPPLCGQPHPHDDGITCDYHQGHKPLDAWPAFNNPDKRRIVYAHGNSKVRFWWKDDDPDRPEPAAPRPKAFRPDLGRHGGEA